MKLEDIKKKNIYSVPDKYFDELPGKIQERVTAPKPVFGFSFSTGMALKLAGPALAVILLVFYFGVFTPNQQPMTAEAMLAQVSNNDLVAYLETTDITTDDILNEIDLDNMNLNFGTENSLLKDMDLDDQQVNDLYDELGIDYETL